jgi:hypothetical protein
MNMITLLETLKLLEGPNSSYTNINRRKNDNIAKLKFEKLKQSGQKVKYIDEKASGNHSHRQYVN